MQKNLFFTILLVLIAQNVLAQDKLSETTSSLPSDPTKDVNNLNGSKTDIEATNYVSESQEADVYFVST